MSHTLAYWHSGGEVLCARNLPLTSADIDALQGLHTDEARAAARAGDLAMRTRALNLARQLSAAAGAANRWRQASRAYPGAAERSR